MAAPKTVISVFKLDSRAQFLESPMFYCGSKLNFSKSLVPGTRILFSDIESKEIFGSARVGVFPDGSGLSVRAASPMDETLYGSDYAGYNKFQICLEKGSVRLFTVSYADIAFLVGIEASTQSENNLTLPSWHNFVPVRYRGANQETVNRRIELWLRTL